MRHSQRLLNSSLQLLGRIFLVLIQQVQMKLDIPRLVNTVYVSECSRNTKVGIDRVQCGVDIPHISGLSVQ